MELSLTLKKIDMENSDRPAFSTQHTIDGNWNTEPDRELMGLTKREYFAAMAMQSIIKIKGVGTYDISRNYEGVCNDIAQASIRVADELLKQLES